jgi:hypothetical protein
MRGERIGCGVVELAARLGRRALRGMRRPQEGHSGEWRSRGEPQEHRLKPMLPATGATGTWMTSWGEFGIGSDGL